MRFVSSPLRRQSLEERQDDSSGSCTPRIQAKDGRKGWFRSLGTNRTSPQQEQPSSASGELELSMGKSSSDVTDGGAAPGVSSRSRSSSSRRLGRDGSQRRFPSQVLADAIASSWQRVHGDHRVEVLVSSLGPWASSDSSKTPPLTPPPTSPLRRSSTSPTPPQEGPSPSTNSVQLTPPAATLPASETSTASPFVQTAPPQQPQLDHATATTTSPTATPQQEPQTNLPDGLITCLSTITDISSNAGSSDRNITQQAQAWQPAAQPAGAQVFGATVPGTTGSQWVVAPDPRPTYFPPHSHTVPRVSYGPMAYHQPPRPLRYPYLTRQLQSLEPRPGAAYGMWGQEQPRPGAAYGMWGQEQPPSAGQSGQAYGHSAFHTPPVPTTQYQQWQDGTQYPSRMDERYEDDDQQNRFRILQSASSSEFEWTPQDSAYGAAFPVCGWLPKPIRRAIEATIIAIGIMALCFLLISISIRLASGDGKSGTHKKNDEDEGGSSSSSDDDDDVAGGNNDRDDDDDDDYNSGGPYQLDDDYYQVTVNDDDNDDYYGLDDDAANDYQAADDEVNDDDANDYQADDDDAGDDAANDENNGDDAVGNDDAAGDDNAGDDDGGNRFLEETSDYLHKWYEEIFHVDRSSNRALRRIQRRRRRQRQEEEPLLQPRRPQFHVPTLAQPPQPLHIIQALPI